MRLHLRPFCVVPVHCRDVLCLTEAGVFEDVRCLMDAGVLEDVLVALFPGGLHTLQGV